MGESSMEGNLENRKFTQVELVAKVLSEGKEYQKTGTTKARVLTAEDFEQYGGIIQTKEGHQSFEIGDFLAVGVEGEEWPISKETMERTKEFIRMDGIWGIYKNTNTVKAVQINESFEFIRDNDGLMVGQAGDYFVYDEEGQQAWIVAQSIFKTTYVEN